jgi:YHS domain-containing protein
MRFQSLVHADADRPAPVKSRFALFGENMTHSWKFLLATNALGFFFLFWLVGCGKEGSNRPSTAHEHSQSAADKSNNSKLEDAHHDHKPGAHGGIIVAIGKDNYHGEAVFEKGGIVRLFTLGHDEMKLLEIDAEPIAAFVKAEGDTDAVAFVFRPEPQRGDTQGKTSQFVGHMPRELWGKTLEITIPSIRIGMDRFRVSFKSTNDAHAVEPARSALEDETKLYLTPGGKYTREDIRANGNMTAPQKFKGLRPSHDLKPKSGDKICPITLTKANPQFSWIIGGKTYEFCCPPCVDEFVARAKTMPEDIKEPEYYRKK